MTDGQLRPALPAYYPSLDITLRFSALYVTAHIGGGTGAGCMPQSAHFRPAVERWRHTPKAHADITELWRRMSGSPFRHHHGVS
ncbi:MAG: hypothetical protein JXQ97_09215 [Natronospirillum sp.]